jgi:FtsH-binding integral membrane protein
VLSTETVWDRRQTTDKEISDAQYNLTIGMVLSWGFGVNYLMIQSIPAESVLSINRWVFLIGYFISVMIGTAIYTKSDNPAISFAGYNFIVIPIGLLLVKFLYFFEADVISQAFLTTGLVTLSIMAVASVQPKFFLSIGSGLSVAFIVAFIVEMGMYFITGAVPPIFDWIFVLIFSGYIGYDWARAQALPKTTDNAVDCAAALYVDIVILFMRLLRIVGRRD